MPTTCSKLPMGAGSTRVHLRERDIRKNVSELKMYQHFNNYYVPIHLEKGAQFPFLLQAVPTASFPLPPLGTHRRNLQL